MLNSTKDYNQICYIWFQSEVYNFRLDCLKHLLIVGKTQYWLGVYDYIMETFWRLNIFLVVDKICEPGLINGK